MPGAGTGMDHRRDEGRIYADGAGPDSRPGLKWSFVPKQTRSRSTCW